MRRADIEVPNLPVDVNSWGRSACYPRSTFYPLSDGLSVQHRRITRSDFRLCSTCRSRSQAPFCPYTLRAITDRTEGTFESLRYSFGGDRPSQTTHLTLSLPWIHTVRLETRHDKGGIPLAAPPRLAPRLQSLPPILYMPCQIPMPGCSKGSRGLFVLPRVGGIFTPTTISPSRLPRQCPNRYTIRAGRNLPAKEFRSPYSVILITGWTISSSGLREIILYFSQSLTIGGIHFHCNINDFSQTFLS